MHSVAFPSVPCSCKRGPSRFFPRDNCLLSFLCLAPSDTAGGKGGEGEPAEAPAVQWKQQADWVPRENYVDLRCFFRGGAKTVLLLKRINSPRVTRAAAQLARYLSFSLGLIVVVEPPAAEEFAQATNDKVPLKTSAAAPPGLGAAVDFVVCIGGDGTMLWGSSLFPENVPPVLGVSMGSLGYLTHFEVKEMKAVAKAVAQGPFAVTLRCRLLCGSLASLCMRANGLAEIRVLSANGELVQSCVATNECVIDRGLYSCVSVLDVHLGNKYFTTVTADGLIVATPTGSTAYSMSAGGSIVHPKVPCILFTPICPHSLSFRPLILPDTAVLRVYVPPECRGSAWVAVDGHRRREITQGMCVEVAVSPYPLPLVVRDTACSDQLWMQSLRKGLNWNMRVRQQEFFPAGGKASQSSGSAAAGASVLALPRNPSGQCNAERTSSASACEASATSRDPPETRRSDMPLHYFDPDAAAVAGKSCSARGRAFEGMPASAKESLPCELAEAGRKAVDAAAGKLAPAGVTTSDPGSADFEATASTTTLRSRETAFFRGGEQQPRLQRKQSMKRKHDDAAAAAAAASAEKLCAFLAPDDASGGGAGGGSLSLSACAEKAALSGSERLPVSASGGDISWSMAASVAAAAGTPPAAAAGSPRLSRALPLRCCGSLNDRLLLLQPDEQHAQEATPPSTTAPNGALLPASSESACCLRKGRNSVRRKCRRYCGDSTGVSSSSPSPAAAGDDDTHCHDKPSQQQRLPGEEESATAAEDDASPPLPTTYPISGNSDGRCSPPLAAEHPIPETPVHCCSSACGEEACTGVFHRPGSAAFLWISSDATPTVQLVRQTTGVLLTDVVGTRRQQPQGEQQKGQLPTPPFCEKLKQIGSL
ncbi:NAD(+) NADH kinase domain-containing protein [Cyclospora cayetanensis]|uniref:NAD(+) NADH kinase domain-containing protein n=1 Tax=Cyclospora cayetanensis TaxID=88456 RepID=A0A1D3D7V9_9EIME|nr:NAD(+) NADH kinase domain-containing protein [Cyclospora cayetanensis]